MKVKLFIIVQSKDIFNRLINQKMPVSAAYKIMKISKAVEEECAFYTKRIQELIEKYGEKDKNNNYVLNNGNVQIKKDLEEECNKEISELENLEVDLPDIFLSLEDLNSTELTPREIFILEPFLEK